MKLAFFTICAKNYLPYARTLMNSLQKQYGNTVSYYTVMSDSIDSYFNPEKEFFSVIEASSFLSKHELADMSFRYDITEFSTAIKPKAFLHLFSQKDYDAIIYLDPDILVMNKLTEVEELLLNGAEAVVTPHICKPLEDGDKPDDQSMLQAGIYNFGFVAFSKSDESTSFLEWWHRRLEKDCRSDLKEGLFVDQKWADLLPSFIGNTSILRHPGYNVAYWNLLTRSVFLKKGRWLVDDMKLIFFHFSGVESPDKNVFSKHQTRFNANNIGDVKILLNQYRSLVEKNGKKELSSWPYAFGFVNEVPIPSFLRRIYREKIEPNLGTQSDPFAASLVYCNEKTNDLPDYGFYISHLMHHIWEQRIDLQNAFNLSERGGQDSFINWFAHSAPRELNLHKVFYENTSTKKKIAAI